MLKPDAECSHDAGRDAQADSLLQGTQPAGLHEGLSCSFHSNGIKTSCISKSVFNSMKVKKYDCSPAFLVVLSTRDEPDSILSQYKAIKRI